MAPTDRALSIDAESAAVEGATLASSLDPGIRRVIRRNRRRKYVVAFTQVALLVTAITLWQLLSGPKQEDPTYLLDSYYFSRPSDVVDALRSWAESGELLSAVLATFQVALLGLILGLTTGILTGFVLGINSTLSSVLNPFVAALYSIPRLALIPLLLLWFGLGIGAKLALVVIITFFLVFYNTYTGVREVDQQLVNVLKVMGANRRQIYMKVILQSAMVWVIAGLRIAVPWSLVAAVTAEMIVSDQGMGYLVYNSASQFYTQGVFAAILVMMAMSLLLTAIVNLIEARMLHWK